MNIRISALVAAGIFTATVFTSESETLSLPSAASRNVFNPAISVAVDGFYYHEGSDDGMGEVMENLAGVDHAHADELEHEHALENGFNLRHFEIQLSAELDRYFKAMAIVAVEDEEALIEEAWLETIGLPWGLTLRAGRFFSNFGVENVKHPHQWDFTDRPLLHDLLLGDHGLNETGVQLSWLAPTRLPLRIGIEALQGENEKMFNQREEEALPEHDGPRLGVGWLKFTPLQEEQHHLDLGFSALVGRHQEEHDEGGGPEYFDGHQWMAGSDLVYTYDSGRAFGQGDWALQAEYYYRSKDLDLENAGESGSLESTQDGYYIQGLYGFLPRWRGGLRWEQVGLTNEETEEETETFDSSWRASAMMDYRPTPATQIRFQLNHGTYATLVEELEGEEEVWEAFLQFTFMLGSPDACAGCGGVH